MKEKIKKIIKPVLVIFIAAIIVSFLYIILENRSEDRNNRARIILPEISSNDYEDLESMIYDLESRIEELEDQISHLEGRIDDAEYMIYDNESNISDLEWRMDDLEWRVNY